MSELAAWCIYCGGELIDVGKGEHVLPDAIGCTATMPCVCTGCNTGILSKLVEVLVCRSHLSVVRFKWEREKLRLAWDIDHADGNLLLDAKPIDGTFSSFPIWPQMIVETDSVQFRADESDLKNQDARTCARIFSQHLRHALRTLQGGGRKKVYFPPQVSNVPTGYRYPPRVFAERRIADFADGMKFKCGYSQPGDNAEAIQRLEKELGEEGPDFGENLDIRLGSNSPVMALSFSYSGLVRALTNLAINLLANHAGWEQVNYRTFPEAVRFVMNARLVERLHHRRLNRCGFVRPDDLAVLSCPPNAHKIRLVYNWWRWNSEWCAYSSFYGNEIAARCEFEGPRIADWSTLDVTAYLGSKDWEIVEYTDIMDVDCHVVRDVNLVVPSLPPVINEKITFSPGRQRG